MSEDKSIKLFTAAKELNIGTGTIVDFLATKGYKIQKHPTTQLNGDMYSALLKEFAVDKIIKEEAKQISIGKIRKEDTPPFPEKPVENRRSRDFENEEILIKNIGHHYTAPVVEKPKPVEPKPEDRSSEALPGVTVVGKIDLNNLNNFIMKGMTIKGVLFLNVIISLMLACNTKQEEPAAVVIDKEQIKKEIQAKEDSFAAVYNSGELRNIGYYADDATSFFQNRAPLVGKEAIIAFLKADITSNTDRISFKTNEVFVSNDGNLVVEVGSFKVVDSVNTPINTGNYMTMFEKRNGSYVAVRDMSASDGTSVK